MKPTRLVRWTCQVTGCETTGIRPTIGASASEAREHMRAEHKDLPAAKRKAPFKTVRADYTTRRDDDGRTT